MGANRKERTVRTVGKIRATASTLAGTVATVDDRETLRQRLTAGEWLRTGEAAVLLQVGRTKMHKLVRDGIIRHRVRAGGVQRLCHPADVARLLAESELVHGSDEED
jgi:excisionase family DNA binding protein